MDSIWFLMMASSRVQWQWPEGIGTEGLVVLMLTVGPDVEVGTGGEVGGGEADDGGQADASALSWAVLGPDGGGGGARSGGVVVGDPKRLLEGVGEGEEQDPAGGGEGRSVLSL
jgi:hypothetical protein